MLETEYVLVAEGMIFEAFKAPWRKKKKITLDKLKKELEKIQLQEKNI